MFPARSPLQWALLGLVGVNGLTILGMVLFSQIMVSRHEREIAVAREAVMYGSQLMALGETAGLASAPGDDVFESRDAAAERQRLGRTLTQFYQQLAELNAFHDSGAAYIQTADISGVGDAMAVAASRSEAVLQSYERGRRGEAARRMAEMDRAYRRVSSEIAATIRRLQRLRSQHLAMELEFAHRLQRLQWVAGLVVLLFVAMVAAYGLAASRAANENGKKLADDAAALEAERAHLEARVSERTEALRQAMAGAQQASEAKSNFIASMSHELRTPLWSIQSYAELLREIAADEGRVQETEDIDKIIGASRHLLALVTEILDFSKIDAGKAKLNLADYDPAELVTSVVQIIRPLARQNGNSVSVNVARGLRCAHNDARKIKQCMLNLASNAAKFTKDGLIVIKADVSQHDGQDWLRFEVRDTGIGIKAEKLETLFQPFVQGEDSTTREYGGTGLGLAITKQLIALMGGAIEAQSAIGEGSVFRFEAPLDLRHAEAEQSMQGEAA